MDKENGQNFLVLYKKRTTFLIKNKEILLKLSILEKARKYQLLPMMMLKKNDTIVRLGLIN